MRDRHGDSGDSVDSASERYTRPPPPTGQRLDASDGGRDAHVRRARPRYLAGVIAGVLAGTTMSMAMMLLALFRGESVWMLPNLIAAMWLGPNVATGALGLPTAVGLLTHEATSALMGIVAVPFVARLSFKRTLLVSLAYALASYPLVFSLVISWANPLMFQRTSMIQMTWGHLLFGAVFGAAYAWLAGRATE